MHLLLKTCGFVSDSAIEIFPFNHKFLGELQIYRSMIKVIVQ